MILSEIVKAENAIRINKMENVKRWHVYEIFKDLSKDGCMAVLDEKKIKKGLSFHNHYFAPKNSIAIITNEYGEIKTKRFMENDSSILANANNVVVILKTKNAEKNILPEYINTLIDIIIYNNFCEFAGVTLKTLMNCVVDATWPSIERQKQIIEYKKNIQIFNNRLKILYETEKEVIYEKLDKIDGNAETSLLEIVSIEQIHLSKMSQLDLSLKLNKKMISRNGLYKLSDLDVEQLDEIKPFQIFGEEVIHLIVRESGRKADVDILSNGYYLLEQNDRNDHYIIKPTSLCELPITVLWFLLKRHCNSLGYGMRFRVERLENIKLKAKRLNHAIKNINKIIRYEDAIEQFSMSEKNICERYLATRNKIEENDIREWLEQFEKDKHLNPYSKENRRGK